MTQGSRQIYARKGAPTSHRLNVLVERRAIGLWAWTSSERELLGRILHPNEGPSDYELGLNG